MVPSSFSFCLSLKLSLYQIWMIVIRQSILGYRFFPFIALNISCHFFLVCNISAIKSADMFLWVPLDVSCWFSFSAFEIFPLIFATLNIMCLGVALFGCFLFGTLCFPNLNIYFLSQFRKKLAFTASIQFSILIVFNYLLVVYALYINTHVSAKKRS